MDEKVVVIEGIRSPFCKAKGTFAVMQPDDLGAYAVKELMAKVAISPQEIDHLIFGNVIQPSHLANIARHISFKAGLPIHIPSYTVNRNCASGLEAVIDAAMHIQLKQSRAVVCGGVESMSLTPILFPKEMRTFLLALSKSKSLLAKLKAWMSFRPSFLIPELPGLKDPLCGLNMGETAELLSREWGIDREKQDQFALQSQQRAAGALSKGLFAEEIFPVAFPSKYDRFQNVDDGIRKNQTMESLATLKPSFDRILGTVTAGNSSQISDGSAALLLCSESKAKELSLPALCAVKAYASVGLDPSRMGLGPVFAISKLLEGMSITLDDIDLFEINEAFAAQVLACLKACGSKMFAKDHLNRTSPLGFISQDKLNVNGGAIALGHPLGASGARLVLTLAKELKRREKRWGIAALCVGGGQGSAILIENEG